MKNMCDPFLEQLVGILNEPGIKKEHDIIREARPTLLQQQQHIVQQQQQQIGGGGTTQQQRERDLVRQALQAVVDGTSPKASDQELIEYNYSAGDIQGNTCDFVTFSCDINIWC